MNQPIELRRATFTDKAIAYHTLSATIGIGVLFLILGAVIAIPTAGLGLLLWAVPVPAFFVAQWYYRLYFSKLECVLTDRKLQVGKGVLFRTEKAIPLDKITDMAMRQGPLLRYLSLEAMSVETAGQSGPGSLVALVGIEGSHAFRAAVLEQRDLVVGTAAGTRSPEPAEAAAKDNPHTDELLQDIRDTLVRIESRLAEAGEPPHTHDL